MNIRTAGRPDYIDVRTANPIRSNPPRYGPPFLLQFVDEGAGLGRCESPCPGGLRGLSFEALKPPPEIAPRQAVPRVI